MLLDCLSDRVMDYLHILGLFIHMRVHVALARFVAFASQIVIQIS
jgi:hypothetical protein